jgi:redox-sensitive bicupin YhaK (pirin superfamily)
MIQKISSENRHLATHSWLSTYHLFSFADYFDPNNMNFGVLRVFNDDTIDAHNGFGQHGHRDMEIVTLVLTGELTHTDSMGNSGTIKAGEVQYMSAGSGVMHSEVNNSDEAVHLYQIWIQPKHKNLTPNYGQKDFAQLITKNTLVPVISDKEVGGAIHIEADVTIYLCELEGGKDVDYRLEVSRGLFIYIQTGSIIINGEEFVAGDQARIADESAIQIVSIDGGRFVAIDVVM